MNSNKGSPQLTYKPANFDDISKRDNDPDVLVKGKLQYLKGKKEGDTYLRVGSNMIRNCLLYHQENQATNQMLQA